MSLDAVPLIAVVNTPSGLHLKIGLVRAYATGSRSACGTRQVLFFLKKFYKKGSAFSFFVDLLYWEWKFPQYGNLKIIYKI